MRLLIFEWAGGTFTYPDIIEYFNNKGIGYNTVSYNFRNINEDEFFEYRFGKELNKGFDAVFSVNFFPLVAKCCNKAGIKYVSWSYDNPLDIPQIEKTLGLPVNHVFMFDRIQVKKYRDLGFDNVNHMPLAVNCRRLDAAKLSGKDIDDYGADVSFVGRMYESMYSKFAQYMDEYCKGYIDAVIAAQSKVYGYYMVDDMLNEGIMKHINEHFKELDPDTDFFLSKEALSFAMGSEITRRERIIILNILSKRYKLNLYSWDYNELLGNVNYRGTCDYITQMPKIFKASRVDLNINLRISQSGIPQRVLDILGCGAFLISNYQPEIDENFVNGEEVVMYDSVEDACEKAIYYIENVNERERIAKNGYAKVRELFSYEKQLGEILRISGIE